MYNNDTQSAKNTKTLFLIVGRTAAGKDSLVSAVSQQTGVPTILSYTTRSRRIGEGDTHIFIAPDMCHEMNLTKGVAAQTIINDTIYFTTIDQIDQAFETIDAAYYIIDPNGLDDIMKKHPFFKDNILFITIFIDVPFFVRAKRALRRGDKLFTFLKRNWAERHQFRDFKKAKRWDYHIHNKELHSAQNLLSGITWLWG